MSDKQKTGRQGEESAVAYLIASGYAILEQNWRDGHREVDIIARIGNTLVIAEVKTRLANWNERPEDFLPPSKQEALIAAAETYLSECQEDAIEVRFDLLIVRPGKQPEVQHIPHAFIPGL